MRIISRQREVQERISTYNKQVLVCLDKFRSTLNSYCETSDRDELSSRFEEVHKAEGRADDIRRELEELMYAKSLFPESRGDILGLIESMDKVPNYAEEAIRSILNQYITIPGELGPRIMDLAEVCFRSVQTMIEGVEQIFGSFQTASVTVGKIDQLESDADSIEADLINTIFSSKYADLHKILLRDLVERISSIADRAENVGDRIRLIVAKRSI